MLSAAGPRVSFLTCDLCPSQHATDLFSNRGGSARLFFLGGGRLSGDGSPVEKLVKYMLAALKGEREEAIWFPLLPETQAPSPARWREFLACSLCREKGNLLGTLACFDS